MLRGVAVMLCSWWFKIDIIDYRTQPDSQRPAVVVGNHSSPFDFLLGLALFGASPSRLRYMVAEEYFDRIWSRRFLRAIDAIPVDRANGAPALRRALDVARAGISVVVMPEGRIAASDSDELSAISPGAVWLAATAQLPILLVSVAGLREVWPVSARRPRCPVLARGSVRVEFSTYWVTAGSGRGWRDAEALRLSRAMQLQLARTRSAQASFESISDS